MAARLHALVKHSDDLNQARPNDAVVENVHGPSHLGLAVAGARMPKMKTPNPTGQAGAIACRRSARFGGHLAHRGREERCVAPPAFESPSFGADRENLHEIGARRP